MTDKRLPESRPAAPAPSAPPAGGIRLPAPGRWAFAAVGLAAFAFLLHVYAGIWTPEHGITKFLRVGQLFDERALDVFKATPKFVDPYPDHRWGFDGQLYAQMALDPLLRDPHLHVALDNPPYRAQRILLSWLAWLAGLGQPFWVINAYAAMNLVFWIGFAWLAGRLFAAHGWSGLAGYAAVLLTCGLIESMQASLTDLPSFTLILAAIVAGGTKGAVLLALAALVRSTSLIGFVGLAQVPPPWGGAIRRNLKWGAIAVVPFVLWAVYVHWVFRGREVYFDGGNLAMPFQGMMEKLGEFSVTAVHGPIRWHRFFFELYKSYDLHAVLTIVAVVTQSVYLALHREWKNPLWRWGAVVAVYFSCISFLSWESHFTITRHALPITLVFNLLLAMRPTKAWLVWFLLGNCFVPFGVRYFDGMREFRTPPPPPEFVVAAPAGSDPVAGPGVSVRFDTGWTPQQWTHARTWRWALDRTAAVTVGNSTGKPVRLEVAFLAQTPEARTLEVVVEGSAPAAPQRLSLAAGRSPVRLAPIAFPPGSTRLVLTVDGGRAKSADGAFEQVTWRLLELRVRRVDP